MIHTLVLLATLIAAAVADSGVGHQVGNSKPGDGYDRGNVFLMRLITYPSSGTRARKANTRDNEIDRGEKLAKPFSTILVLESVKEDQNGYLPDSVHYRPPNVDNKPIYVKKLSDAHKQEHSTTPKPHEITLNRHKRTICLKCGHGGGGYGGNYGGGYGGNYGGGYGGGHGGGYGTPTNIIVVPVQQARYPHGGGGGGGHGHGHGHGHGNYGGGHGGGYNQPNYPGPGGCGGGGCGVNYPQQPNYNQGGCGNGGCGGNGGGGSFSQAQASASSGSWSGK